MKRKVPKFKVCDIVRITRKKGIFEKGYTTRWTEEIFTVSEVRYTDPITYKIVDLNNEKIQGSFYEQKLQNVATGVAEIIGIKKLIKRKGNKSLVKWFGYPDKFNSWIGNSDIIKM